MDFNHRGSRDRRVRPDELPWDRILLVAPLVIVVIMVALLAYGSVYRVEPHERAVVMRFGKFREPIVEPGLHFCIPLVDSVLFANVREQGLRLPFGTERGRPSQAEEEETLMLTGDLNAAVVEWIVQYQIKDPALYLFKVRGVPETIRDVAESAMRQIVGDRSVTEVLTVGRVEVANEVTLHMQRLLDEYQTGIEIVTVNLKDVNPPDAVKPSFNEVNQAKQERERMINEAWSEYNQEIPAAQGEAERVIRAAEGYALARVNRAQGDAERFVAVWREYSRAKDVTKRRLYLETMSEILPNIDRKYVVDPDFENLVPLLQFDTKGGQ